MSSTLDNTSKASEESSKSLQSMSDLVDDFPSSRSDFTKVIGIDGDVTGRSLEDLHFCGSTFHNLTVRCSFGSIRCIDYAEKPHLLVIGEKNRGARIVFPDTYGSVQFGGDETVRSAKFSPDGKYVFTGGDDRIVRMWKVKATHPDSEKQSSNSEKQYEDQETVNPKAALVVESVGPLWGDENRFHHAQKIRSIDCCRFTDSEWLVTSVCEGGRVNIWTFSSNGKPKAHRVWQSKIEGDRTLSWNAVSLIPESDLLVTCGRDKSDPDQPRGILHIYQATSASEETDDSSPSPLREISDDDNEVELDDFQAGWSLNRVDVTDSGGEQNKHRLFVGDYDCLIHVFDVSVESPSVDGSDETKPKVSLQNYEEIKVSETEASLENSRARVFDISLTAYNGGYIAACLEEGSVLVAEMSAPKVGKLRWQTCSSHAPLRARCATFVNVVGRSKEVCLVSGGFDHRLIKRNYPFKRPIRNWQRKGSSSGIRAIAIPSTKLEEDRLSIFTVGQSHKPKQDDVLLWVNDVRREAINLNSYLTYWDRKWSSIASSPSLETTDSSEEKAPEKTANEETARRSHHCIVTLPLPGVHKELVITGGAYGVEEWLADFTDAPPRVERQNGEQESWLTSNKHVWDLAVLGDYVFAACEDGNLYSLKLADGRLEPPCEEDSSKLGLNSGDVVRAVATQNELSLVAAGIDNQPLCVWYAKPEQTEIFFEKQEPVESPDSWVTALDFSEADKDSQNCYLATACDPSGAKYASIKLYRVPDPSRGSSSKWAELVVPTRHTRRITRLLFIDRNTLISASEDGFACVWHIPEDLSQGAHGQAPMVHSSEKHLFEQRLSPIQHDVGIVDMELVRSGHDGDPGFLVTADRNGEVRIWNLKLMNSWFEHDDDKPDADRQNESGNSSLRFTEDRITRLLANNESNVKAICRGAGGCFTSFTQTRLYEGARFRKTKWMYTELKTSCDDVVESSPHGDTHGTYYEVDASRQHVNIQNMANDLSFLGADFISSCRSEADTDDSHSEDS